MLLLIDCCWNHVDCPCCCYDVLLLMIRTLGNHNHWDCCENWFVLEIFTKWVKWWFLFKRCFNSNFIRFWTSFDVWKRLDKLWNQIWAWGIQNWDFGMENEFFVTANCQYSPRRVSLRARRATWSQRAMFARHGEHRVTGGMFCPPRRAGPLATASNVVTERVLCPPRRATQLGRRVASVPVFLVCFLGPFHMFLVWIDS